MTRGNKKFIAAVIATVVAFVIGLFLVGLSDDIAITSTGVVNRSDLLDAYKYRQLLDDPTFKEYYIWGKLRLESKVAALLLFFLFPFVVGVVTAVFSFRKNTD